MDFRHNEIQAELASKNEEIQSLKSQLETTKNNSQIKIEKEIELKNEAEKLNEKYEKLRQILASKVFDSNSKNQNLIDLYNLDIAELFHKYENIKNITKLKIEDTNETL